MIRRRLLERVKDVTSARRAPDDDAAIRTSIVNSLRRVLGTGQNDASIDRAYGLPDVVGFTGLFENDEHARTAAAAMKKAIEKYEPRLKNVRVRRAPDSKWGTLCFDITAELNDVEEAQDGSVKVATRVVAFSGIALDDLDAPRSSDGKTSNG